MAIIKTRKFEPVLREERARARDCDSLITALDDPNPTARRWAARDLTDCPDASTALIGRLTREDDPSVRDVIFTTLTSLGDDVAVAGLVDCLKSEDVALRNEAIEAMKQLPDQVAPIMLGLLANDNRDVRIFAVNILESLRHPDVQSWLIGVIERDPDLNVCATAVDLLGEVGSEAARLPLGSLKRRFPDQPYIQFAVDLALNRISQG